MMTISESKQELIQPEHALQLMPAALTHVHQQLLKRGPCIGIRISTEERGCSGLAFVFDYIDVIGDVVESDLVFPVDEQLSIYVERKSFPFIKGTRIDYVKDGLNKKFVYHNPNQSASCGCGESFTVK